MNKELRRSFANVKKQCDTPEKRKAYNKLFKTFSNKNITRTWLVELIDTWKSVNWNKFDKADLISYATAKLSKMPLEFIKDLVSDEIVTANWLVNDNDLSLGHSEFTNISDFDLFSIIKTLTTYTSISK